MDNRPRPRLAWWRIVGWLVAIAALWYIAQWIRQLDHAVWKSMTDLRIGWLLLAVGLLQLWFLMRYAAWESIIRRHGLAAERQVSLKNWTMSELMRYAPGNIWSFASKYTTSVEHGTTKGQAVQAMVIEASAQVSGAAIVAAMMYDVARWWWVAIALVAVFPLGLTMVLNFAHRRKTNETAQHVSFIEALVLLGWYVLVWVVFGLATACIAHGFPSVLGGSFLWLAGANVAAWLIGYLSVITPMGFGVREVTFVQLVSSTIVNGVASILALITRMWFIASELLFVGFVLLWSKRR